MLENRKIKTTMRKKKWTPKPLVAITIKENSQDHYGRRTHGNIGIGQRFNLNAMMKPQVLAGKPYLKM